MNWNQIEGQWTQLKGRAKSQWGKLTDDDLTVIAGKKDQLVGKLQEHYGILTDEAEDQIDNWVKNIGSTNGKAASAQPRKRAGDSGTQDSAGRARR